MAICHLRVIIDLLSQSSSLNCTELKRQPLRDPGREWGLGIICLVGRNMEVARTEWKAFFLSLLASPLSVVKLHRDSEVEG